MCWVIEFGFLCYFGKRERESQGRESMAGREGFMYESSRNSIGLMHDQGFAYIILKDENQPLVRTILNGRMNELIY